MKSKQTLMAALIGVAMIAMPVAAAAGDHGREANHGSHRFEQGRSFNAPASHDRVERGEVWNHNVVPAFHREVHEAHEGDYRYGENQAPGAVVLVGHHYGWRNNPHFGSHPGLICDEDGDDCHPAARYEDDDEECESGAGYQGGQYYAPSYYGGYAGGNGEVGRLLAVRAQIGVRIARARARGDWRTVNNGYRELRVVNAQLARLGVRRYNRGYSAAPGYLSPSANLLGGYAGVPAYNNYGYNSGYNNGYNAPYYNNPYGGGTLTQLAPLLQQFVH